MALFGKKFFRKITPTGKFEKGENERIQSMERYNEIGRSAELAEYKQLSKVISSPKFQENKKILKNRKYKDTEEYRLNSEYKKLQNSRSLQQYFKTSESKELNDFLKFKETPDYLDLGNRKKVKASEKLKKFKQFEHSKEYKNFVRYNDSFVVKEYEELKQKVNSPEFQKSNEFWANPDRWHTTKEYAIQRRHHQLRKNPDIIYYENENPERFGIFRSLELTFEENFEWNTLDSSRWNYGFHYKSPQLITDHSFANEKQANNSGKNVTVSDGHLKIITKEEKITARAWDTQKGFIMKDFDYSSDVIQTDDTFRQKYGMFRAKLRCSGKIHHAFWLGGDEMLPHINIFHFDGKYINVGNASKNEMDGTKIKGIHPSDFYIYSLLWTEKELIWLINDYEVYRTVRNIPDEKLYMALSSFIPEKEKGDKGVLEVDWIKVYQFKQ